MSAQSIEQRQMDYLATQITTLEDAMIDPQEFGRLQAEVGSLRRDMDRMAESLESMATSMQTIQHQLAEARGGWKVMMAVGGASAAGGAVIGKFFSAIFGGAGS